MENTDTGKNSNSAVKNSIWWNKRAVTSETLLGIAPSRSAPAPSPAALQSGTPKQTPSAHWNHQSRPCTLQRTSSGDFFLLFLRDFCFVFLFCLLKLRARERGDKYLFLWDSHGPGTEQLGGPLGLFLTLFFFSFSFLFTFFWCGGLLGFGVFFPLFFSFPVGALALEFEALLSLLGVQSSVLSPCPGPAPRQRQSRGAEGAEAPAPSSPHTREGAGCSPEWQREGTAKGRQERMERPWGACSV